MNAFLDNAIILYFCQGTCNSTAQLLAHWEKFISFIIDRLECSTISFIQALD